jgi:hypothetical protein
VIPIENSTEGSVREALDSFVESDLKIVAQIYLEITHALISNSPLERSLKVYSKDQALAQCRHWLQRHLPHAQLIDAPSTSRAVQIAKEEPGGGGGRRIGGGSTMACRCGEEHPGQGGQHHALLRARAESPPARWAAGRTSPVSSSRSATRPPRIPARC